MGRSVAPGFEIEVAPGDDRVPPCTLAWTGRVFEMRQSLPAGDVVGHRTLASMRDALAAWHRLGRACEELELELRHGVMIPADWLCMFEQLEAEGVSWERA